MPRLVKRLNSYNVAKRQYVRITHVIYAWCTARDVIRVFWSGELYVATKQTNDKSLNLEENFYEVNMKVNVCSCDPDCQHGDWREGEICANKLWITPEPQPLKTLLFQVVNIFEPSRTKSQNIGIFSADLLMRFQRMTKLWGEPRITVVCEDLTKPDCSRCN